MQVKKQKVSALEFGPNVTRKCEATLTATTQIRILKTQINYGHSIHSHVFSEKYDAHCKKIALDACILCITTSICRSWVVMVVCLPERRDIRPLFVSRCTVVLRLECTEQHLHGRVISITLNKHQCFNYNNNMTRLRDLLSPSKSHKGRLMIYLPADYHLHPP